MLSGWPLKLTYHVLQLSHVERLAAKINLSLFALIKFAAACCSYHMLQLLSHVQRLAAKINLSCVADITC